MTKNWSVWWTIFFSLGIYNFYFAFCSNKSLSEAQKCKSTIIKQRFIKRCTSQKVNISLDFTKARKFNYVLLVISSIRIAVILHLVTENFLFFFFLNSEFLAPADLKYIGNKMAKSGEPEHCH